MSVQERGRRYNYSQDRGENKIRRSYSNDSEHRHPYNGGGQRRKGANGDRDYRGYGRVQYQRYGRDYDRPHYSRRYSDSYGRDDYPRNNSQPTRRYDTEFRYDERRDYRDQPSNCDCRRKRQYNEYQEENNAKYSNDSRRDSAPHPRNSGAQFSKRDDAQSYDGVPNNIRCDNEAYFWELFHKSDDVIDKSKIALPPREDDTAEDYYDQESPQKRRRLE